MCGDNILRLYENHALLSLSLSLSLFFRLSISLCSRDVSNGFGSILRVDGTRNVAIVFLTRGWCAGSFRRCSISKSTYRVTKYISVRVRA